MAFSNPFLLNLIYILFFLDILGVSMIIPVISTIRKQLSIDPVTFGLINSMYGK